jgi:outer membrane receptor protein involved in Fe transport
MLTSMVIAKQRRCIPSIKDCEQESSMKPTGRCGSSERATRIHKPSMILGEFQMKHTYAHGVTAMVSTAALLGVTLTAAGQEPEEVIVTGSYIRGTPEDAASPVDVISRDDFISQGAVLPSDIIANLNINSGSTTNLDAAQENNNIAGKGNVNLRNLGLNSTLVLVNSKRQTVAAARTQRGETFVDINEIPAVMIERVEVLKNGASATYGSDAIAGVVNFITRQDFTGAEFSSQYLRTGSSNQDDLSVGGVVGWAWNDNRTNLVVGADYLDRSSLPVNDKNLQDIEDNGGIFGARVTQNLTPQIPRNPAFGSLNGGDFTDPGCAAAGGFTGFENEPMRAECRFDTRRYQVYVPETERLNSMVHFSHEFSEKAQFYAEALYSQTDLALPTADVQSPVGTQFLQLPVGVPGVGLGALNPTGVLPNPLNAPIRVANGGFGNLNLMDFAVGTYGDPTSVTNDSETQRFVVGLKGDLPMLGRAVGYDVSFGYSRNESVRREDSLNKDRLELALNGLGGPNCVPNGVANLPLLESPALAPIFRQFGLVLAAPFDPEYPLNNRGNISLALSSTNQGQGGCMFFNPYLSSVNGTGPANDPALLEYLRLRDVRLNDSMTELMVADVVFTADLWEMDAGPAAGALGLQWRKERRTSDQTPERFGTNLITSVNPATGATTLRPVSNDAVYGTLTNLFDASQDVRSVFAELQVPVTRSLDVQLAVRYEGIGLDTDFTPQSLSYQGTLDNVDDYLGDEVTSKVALRWQALDQVAIRGSYAQSFRTPNLGLLFEGSGYDGAATLDPLGALAVRNGSRDPSEVLTDPTLAAQSRRGFLRLGLPSPELEPETADSYDLGVILTPIKGLSLTLDYYRVDFEDAIIPTPFSDVLQRQVAAFNLAKQDPNNFVLDGTFTTPCARGSSANCVVNPAAYFIPGVNNAPAPVERVGSTLAIVRLNDINAASIETDGLEFEGSYNFGVGNGRLVLATQWNWINKFEVESGGVKFDAAGHTNDAVPIRSMPDLRGNGSVTWLSGNHVLTGIARHIGSYADDFNEDTINSYTTFDMQYGYRWNWSSQQAPASLRLGVIDLFDEDIPRREGISRGYDSTVFSPNGRRFYLQFTQEF